MVEQRVLPLVFLSPACWGRRSAGCPVQDCHGFIMRETTAAASKDSCYELIPAMSWKQLPNPEHGVSPAPLLKLFSRSTSFLRALASSCRVFLTVLLTLFPRAQSAAVRFFKLSGGKYFSLSWTLCGRSAPLFKELLIFCQVLCLLFCYFFFFSFLHMQYAWFIWEKRGSLWLPFL